MRLKWIVIGVLLAALAMVLPVAAQESTNGSPGTIWGLISVDRAEVRAGPDFVYNIVGQLPLNASVEVLGRAGQFVSSWNGRQWIQIDYGGQRAWIYARLVRTSVSFNNLPVVGIQPPRDANGRVPEVFARGEFVCDSWTGSFERTGDFMAGDTEIVVTFPPLEGATVYSVIVITPGGYRIPFDTTQVVPITIPIDSLPRNAGTYTWRVAPYWTTGTDRSSWQQICPLRTGGTFEKPATDSNVPNAY